MKSRAAKTEAGRASMKGSCSVWAVTGLLICCVGSGFAVAASKSVSMNLRVLVDAPPPCTVNGAAVEFGNVFINKINGVDYKRPIDYSLVCNNLAMDDLRLQMQATTVVINGETVISTGIPGFGIRVQKSSDHTILDLTSGSWLPFNFSSGVPVLEAVPVKQSGTTLAAAEFNASATIVVDYQ
ncbi:fimbrial protein [Escherichia coli]|nr:fimbrial protein [Escherichia coli]EJF8616082.1 fimbrial protein [Escherichia coli]